MRVFTTDKIRNVVLLGHSGAGKSSLVAAMQKISGGAGRMGTEATTEAAVYPIVWEDTKINLLDTPGASEFSQERSRRPPARLTRRSLWFPARTAWRQAPARPGHSARDIICPGSFS